MAAARNNKMAKKTKTAAASGTGDEAARAPGVGMGRTLMLIAVGLAAFAVALASTPAGAETASWVSSFMQRGIAVFEDSVKGNDDSLVNSSSEGADSSAEQLAPGVLSTRRPPTEVEFMPAEMAATHEVTDAEQLPYVKYLLSAPSRKREQAMGVTFRSFFRFDVTMWWDDGTPVGVYSGIIRAGATSATNTYTTHTFNFRRKSDNKLVASETMVKGRSMVFLGPVEDDKAMLESEKYQSAVAERDFRDAYFEAHDTPWLSHYPPVKPVLSLWPADFVGQEHKLRSYVGYFSGEDEQSSEPVDLTIKVVSVEPRVVVIENLLSPFEIEHIVSLGQNVVRRSSVGNAADGFQSDTRTSDNGWISRRKSHVIDTVYDRFADVLNMTGAQMTEGRKGNIEHLQFVRYRKTQKYEPHHDFGYTGKPNQRFSTLFIYLQNAAKGGATSFPKAFGGRGIKVKPPAGTAVLFYSMLEDGNGDDLSLHSGMPVEEGEKLAANLWSWTPSYN